MIGLKELYAALLKAWNDRNAEAMSSYFSEDAVMIGFDGSTVEGRSSIKSHLAPIFQDHPTATYVSIVRSVHDMGEFALLRADAGMVPPGKSDIRSETIARQTLVARHDSNSWQVVQFQNTPITLDQDKPERARIYDELQTTHREGAGRGG